MSEIRHNKLTGEWVIVAPERAKRGGNVRAAQPAAVPKFSPDCPFCPGNEALTGAEQYCARSEEGEWMVRSVVNKFSVLSPTGEVDEREGCPGLGETVNGVGLHEVIVETPRHELTLATFRPDHVSRVFEAYRARFLAFYADPRVRHVILFKNHGVEAGASQQHPHSQIVGLPIVPGQIVERLERDRRFFSETGECLACQIIAEERAQGCRIVAENDHFVSFIPYAALSPFHLWVFPKAHTACFSAGPSEALPALAEILHGVLAKLYGLLGNPSFNLVMRTLGPAEEDLPYSHWYVSIIARVNRVAGLELGTGMYVNPSSPEVCAKALREWK